MTQAKESELTLAPDGTLYHIRLSADTLADNVILVGDPERVNMFRPMMQHVEYENTNREMHTLTGSYHGQRLTVMSTGMGCDNIDIVMTELDAAANMDLRRRCPREQHRTLNIIRIGTCGSLQAEADCGSLVASAYAIGMDGLLNYYAHDPALLEQDLNREFVAHMQFPTTLATPYSAQASTRLLGAIAPTALHGITATAPGFYAPQGRHVRIAPALPHLNEKLASFRWNGLAITNLEMETSAIYGMSRIMGHNALTVCLVIANRTRGTFLNDYHAPMRDAIGQVLDNLAKL
ncbi:MAG: nucleoside phosphorylase [Bacteroidales bacterium]|nr:nucleoside phosphorylase [Bacteroidales bacterium]